MVLGQVLREPAAINMLNQSLSVLGGDVGWAKIKSARIEGTVKRSQAATQSIPIVWLEDLSEGQLRSARTFGNGGSSKRYIAQKSQQDVTTDYHGHKLVIPQTIPLEQIAMENPAILIKTSLSNPNISICHLRNTYQFSRDTEKVTWIRIYQSTGSNRVILFDAAISNETLLPTRVRRHIPRITTSSPPSWQESFFHSYHEREGLQWPSDIVIHSLNTVPMYVHFDREEVNIPFSENDFGASVQ